MTDTGWNFADVWEVVADAVPDAPAQVQGDRRLTWSQFDKRADGVARALLDAGAAHQDKVAQYLYNCPEYLESVFASLKAGLVHLWDNADAMAVVFHGTFTDRIEAIRSRVPNVRLWLWVDDGSDSCPAWAQPYEAAAASASDRVVAPWGRTGDDILMLYTGG